MPRTSRLEIETSFGAKLRELRLSRGLTQAHIANAMGVTYQQAHKYETGVNRLTAGRLWQICRLFDVPPEHFFGDLDGDIVKPLRQTGGRLLLETSKMLAELSFRDLQTISTVVKNLRQTADAA